MMHPDSRLPALDAQGKQQTQNIIFSLLKSLQEIKIVNSCSLQEKLFYLIQYKNGWLAASDRFDMFTQSIKFYYTFYYHVL